MKTITTTFRLTAVAAALIAAYGSASAQDDEIKQLTEPDSSISVGAGYWSNDRQQQGVFDGMRDDHGYALIDADVVKRDDATGTWFKFKGDSLGLESRKISVEVQQQGNMGGFVSYSRIPRESPLEIRSGIRGVGSERMTISGAGASALPFHDVDLATYRDLIHVGFSKNLLKDVDLKLSFKNEEKNGSRHWGMGSQPLFIAEPIDSTTQQLDVTLEYSGEKLQVAGGYAGSWYRNQNDMAFALVNGAAQPGSTSSPNPAPLSLPLDNEAHQFFLNAGYSFTPSTRGTLKVSRSVATQDETIPSIGLAAPNNAFVGAPSKLDGEIVTSLVELGLSSRPTSKLSLNANLRYHDVDDNTPLFGFVGNNTTRAVTVHNTPHSYETKSGKVEASYLLPERFKLIGGVEFKDQDRSAPKFVDERYVPFAESIEETTYRLQLRRSMSETLNGSIAFLHSSRDGSARVSPHDPEIFDAINPLHIADRTRNKWRLSLDWAPVEAFSMQFNVEDSHDDYQRENDRPFGLKDGRATLVSIDARYAFSDNWQVTGWASHDVTRAKQLAGRWARDSDEFSDINLVKDADLKDTGNSVGLGLRGALTPKLKIGADLEWTRTESSYDEDTTVTGTLPVFPTSSGVTGRRLPDIENRLTRLSMFARYAIRKNADVQLDLIHERWKTDDWSWSFADGSNFTYGTTTDGTTVSIKPKQTANFIGARYIYKFQ
ncbi:MtrB/PioB family decaheme-associated outer membrane protein [Aromatoleum petrolei]|uniref:MtrB/PioB family decaheme-associated outer membrane protein n=1 Tax=Aromatoleum petrolei TaxID=76116 RepID=A0ABX1MMC8_9RHOO|nr:MtrB/PioB family decaheme-associated outer membrane protein [Aromatoleum petrolei]NMF89108.1 MtrB/PioB family decaheme-associated outer membrane protein [Aromatoleum petrolei]QTQ38299.1 Decaheme-associated outer membrane protein, MtrB/PioB family [Aromatoleum petrolei]